MRKKSIGVFDSGFGGITILKGLVKELPLYNYIYIGDTARAPYGTRTPETIYEFTKQALEFLFAHDCDLVILACNTASATALRKIQTEYLPRYYPDRKVLGVLIPMAEQTTLETQSRKIGIIATEATVNSKAFIEEIKKIDPKTKVFQRAAPLLVPIIEAGEYNSPIAVLALKQYLKPILAQKIDTLVLGCTHYGILTKKIEEITGKRIKIISGSTTVAKKLKEYLQRHPEIEKRLKRNQKVSFYTTELTSRFTQLGSRFFGRKIKGNKISLS